jgi:DNA-binding transcriptional LysR family regulator
MRNNAISLRQLRFVVELADTANFSRAAERVAVSQPALSSAIREVEALVGMRLFDRTTHRVSLTEAGRSFLPHAQRLLKTADNAFADMHDVARRGQAIVRIGAIPSAVPAVAEILSRIDQEAEGLSLHLADGKSDVLIAELQKGAIDLAICVIAQRSDGLVATTLVEDDMLLVLPRDHKFAGETKLAWSALEGQEIVHFAGGSIGELSAAAMRQNHLTSSTKYRIDQVDSLLGIVTSGLAVGVMPRLYTRGFSRDRVALIPLVQPAIKRRVVLMHRGHLADEHPPASAVVARLQPMLRDLLRANQNS